MRVVARVPACVVGLVLTALSVGFAGPSAMAYSDEPLTLGWTADGPVLAIATYGDRIYVGGQFTGGIAALDASTGALIWTATADSTVYSLALSADGSRLMAGGNFITVNGESRKRLVALTAADGAVVSNWKPRASGQVRDLVVDGNIVYVGGKFGAINGTRFKGLGAVYVDTGSRVESFNHASDKPVLSLALGGGRLVASGTFTLIDGQARHSLASFDLASHALTSWAPARVCSSCATYHDVATDGVNAYVGVSGPGGQFAAFNLDTAQQPWPYVHTDGDVQAVSVGNDGLVYIGGHFGQYVRSREFPRTQMAAIRISDGSVAPFAPRMYTSYPGVQGMTATSDRLYVGGSFTGVNQGGSNNHVPYLAVFGT